MSAVNDVFDGLLSDQNDDMLQRVCYLEKRTIEQADEISCLKGAMSDCVRRLTLLETSRGMFQSQDMSPSKQLFAASRASSVSKINYASNQRSRTQQKEVKPLTGSTTSLTPHQVPSSRHPLTSQTPLNSQPGKGSKHSKPQLPSSRGKAPVKGPALGNRQTSVPGGPTNTKEASFLKDEGILRMYLRGRAITMYAPTDMIADYDFQAVGQEPEEQLKLEWVYGYRGKDCRNNIHFLPTGEIVYFVAAVVVLHHIEQHSQRHYLGHTDDVKSIAIHPDRITVASGQTAGHAKSEGKSHVRVWNSVNLNTLHVIGLGAFENSICCIAFSKADSGNLLCAVDDSSDHTISIWEWKKARRLAETKTSTEPILGVEFSPTLESSLVTYGKGHLGFWTFDNSTLSKKMGIFEKYEKPKFVLSILFAENGDLITGDSNGHIFIWPQNSNRISEARLGAHTGGIFSLCFTKTGNLVSGGGKDHCIITYDSSYNPIGTVVELPPWCGPVRTLASGPAGQLVVGTIHGAILQSTLDMELQPIVQSHSDEFWALASHPQMHCFLTGGKDNNVFLWDSLTKRVIWAENVSEEIVCADFYPAVNPVQPAFLIETAGDTLSSTSRLPDSVPVVAMGTASGRWIVMDTTLHQVISVTAESSEPIQCIAFSPSSGYIAAGCRDNSIYVYKVAEQGSKFSRLGKCTGHSSFILHVDWSEDSQYLRSTSGDYELLYWSIPSCRQITAVSSMCDVRWATNNCQLGWHVAGIWPEGSDGTDINTVSRSHSLRLLATGDDFGKVNLFRYPVSQLQSKCRAYGGHSSHVTNVQFLFDDSRLISAGGADTAILQWEIVA